MGNGFFTVCGVTEIDGKVLFVRHTYGMAKDRILCPGGYVEENELPTVALEREFLEETGVTIKARTLLSMQFKSDQWCAVFIADYVAGTPRSDNYENSEVLLLTPEEAVVRPDITNMSREIMKMYMANKNGTLKRNPYVPPNTTADDYVMFG